MSILSDLLRHAAARRVLADPDRSPGDHEVARRVLGTSCYRIVWAGDMRYWEVWDFDTGRVVAVRSRLSDAEAWILEQPERTS